MALNDWADRELDAVERPERPIPSGRVSPDQALAVAGGLTAAGLGWPRAAGGRDALKVAVPLAAAVWAYDTVLKTTAAGPGRHGRLPRARRPHGRRRATRGARCPPPRPSAATPSASPPCRRGEVHGASPAHRGAPRSPAPRSPPLHRG